MDTSVTEILASHHGVATAQQLGALLSRRDLRRHLECGLLERIWRGVYSSPDPDIVTRLNGLDIVAGTPVVASHASAAALYGFDTERDATLHVVSTVPRQLKTRPGLMVHQRLGAPLRTVRGRLATSPAWTAIELARTLRRPRALATLDAALRTGSCTQQDLFDCVHAQRHRRGIVVARELVELADGAAESPMESESRLVMIDGKLPMPLLQYEIRDVYGQLWRVDFAWPDHRLAAEYDSDEWHTGADAMRRDKTRTARLQESGWTVLPIVADDVRRRPDQLVRRIHALLR